MKSKIFQYKYKRCVFFDAGHGGWNEEKKQYETNGKQWHHKNADLHNNGHFYEGVKNRHYESGIIKRLVSKGINVIRVSNPVFDTPLKTRTGIANAYHKNIQKGIYFSEHSNAISNPKHNATGVAIYTYLRTNKKNLRLADKFIDLFKEQIPEVRFREKNREDGFRSRPKNFHVLRETKMPAFLLENLFFDNLKDAKLLMNEHYYNLYCNVVAEWLELCIKDFE